MHNQINTEQLGLSTKENREAMLEEVSKEIKYNFASFFQQAQAQLAEIPLKKNESGLYSGKSLVLDHIVKSPRLLGIYYILMHNRSKTTSPKQTDPRVLPYCSLVPLILDAYRKYQGIKYSSWDPSEIHTVVEKNLAAAMVEELPALGSDELLEMREKYLKGKLVLAMVE